MTAHAARHHRLQYLGLEQIGHLPLLPRLFDEVVAPPAVVAEFGHRPDWLADVVRVAVATGLRLGELRYLRWSWVDFETGFITVRRTGDFIPKSGSERSIPMVGDALEVLTRLAAQRTDDVDGYAFTGTRGGRLNGNHVSRRFKYYVRLAKLPERTRFHSLRHTCASWLVQRGVSLPIVQAILGHSTIRVTQRYAHLAPDVMQAAMQEAFGGG